MTGRVNQEIGRLAITGECRSCGSATDGVWCRDCWYGAEVARVDSQPCSECGISSWPDHKGDRHREFCSCFGENAWTGVLVAQSGTESGTRTTSRSQSGTQAPEVVREVVHAPAWVPPPPKTELMAELQNGYTAPPSPRPCQLEGCGQPVAGRARFCSLAHKQKAKCQRGVHRERP